MIIISYNRFRNFDGSQ